LDRTRKAARQQRQRHASRLEENNEQLTAQDTPAESLPTDDPFKTFGEWRSEADHRAYDGL
jgi:hypothetical protein